MFNLRVMIPDSIGFFVVATVALTISECSIFQLVFSLLNSVVGGQSTSHDPGFDFVIFFAA